MACFIVQVPLAVRKTCRNYFQTIGYAWSPSITFFYPNFTFPCSFTFFCRWWRKLPPYRNRSETLRKWKNITIFSKIGIKFIYIFQLSSSSSPQVLGHACYIPPFIDLAIVASHSLGFLCLWVCYSVNSLGTVVSGIFPVWFL